MQAHHCANVDIHYIRSLYFKHHGFSILSGRRVAHFSASRFGLLLWILYIFVAFGFLVFVPFGYLASLAFVVS